MDLQNPDSKWSYHRMAYTDNFVIFWEKVLEMICLILLNWKGMI